MRTLYRFLLLMLVLSTGYSFAHAHEGGDDSTHRHGRDSIRMHHLDSIIVHHHDFHHGDSTGFHLHDTIVHHHQDTIIHHNDSTGLHKHDSTELHHHDSTGLHGHDSTGLHGHDSTGHHGWDYHHHRMVDFDSVMYHRFDGDDNIDTARHHNQDSTGNHHHGIGRGDSTGHFNFDSTWVHQLDSLIHRIRQLLDSLHQHNFHFGDNDSTEDRNHDSTGHNGDDTIHHTDTTKINAQQIGTSRGLISQNVFPNPVLSSQSNSTILQYSLDQPEHVTIGLFDANGVLVQNALDADMSAGLHSLAIGISNLRPGAYSLQIQAGSWIRFQRVMVNP